MIRRSAQAALIAALATSLFTASALAQPDEKGAQASEEERAIARRHFMRGKELHAARKYREAAAAYLEAYEHFPSPAFIYNVAQVYRLAGDQKAALANYRKYLELEPDGEGSSDAREFVASLEAELAGEDGPAPSNADDAPASQPLDPVSGRGPGDDRVPSGSPGRGKKILGTTIGAVGVVAIGVAVGFGLRASSAASELSDYRGPWTPDQQQKYDDGQSAERTMVISAVIGGASLAAGATLFYLGHRDARRAASRVQVGAFATDDQALVMVGGAF
jgi:tetratricopeptide (TPR) repeat protein